MNDTTFRIEASLPTDEKTALMSNAALGCYIKLMCFAWREGSVPDDTGQLARLCGEPVATFGEIWGQVSPCFAPDAHRPGRLVHAGIDRQREAAQASKTAKSAAGAIGANRRWSQHRAAAAQQPGPATASIPAPAPAEASVIVAPPARVEPFAPSVPVAHAPRQDSFTDDLFGLDPGNQVTIVPRDPNRLPSCPHLEIVALYHELMPLNPRTLTWNGSRKGYLAARWKEMATTRSELLGNGYMTTEDGMKWWRAFLVHCSRSLLLTGRTPARADHPPFVANLEWILRPNNFAKILEGNYHRGLPAA